MNHPGRHEEASHEGWQLELATRLGLRVPPTCVTSDPAAARSFLRRRGRSGAVMKTLQATPADWRPTRLVGPAVLRRLEVIRRAPVVFQEYVPGLDARVTAVAGASSRRPSTPGAPGLPRTFAPSSTSAGWRRHASRKR